MELNVDVVRNIILFHDHDDEVVFAACQAALLLFDDEHEDRDGPNAIGVDINAWRRMSNATFKVNFRMDRTTFQTHCCGGAAYANYESVNTTTNAIGPLPVDGCVIEILRELGPRYIKWPTALERERISASFERRYGYPGAVGCIDGVHIKVTAPLEQPQRYVQRHGTYSILVQAVCDDRLLYRDIFVGTPGSVGDARNFRRSPLSSNLLTHPEMMSDNEHILGDGAYTLTNKVLIPYVDDGHLNRQQRTHNFTLSRARASVERSFALMRAKNRRTKFLPMRNLEYLIDHVTASFILHNFIILEGHDIQGLPPFEMNPVENYEALMNQARDAGAFKREYIARMLHGNN